MRTLTPIRLFWIASTLAVVVLAVPSFTLDASIARALCRGLLASVVTLAILVASLRLLRWFLWRVGRRLAFSYFLIGVLPIPMVLVLGGIALYLLSGYFLSHQYRNSLATVQRELAREAESGLEHFSTRGGRLPTTPENRALAYYLGGRRVAGAEDAPAQWPSWLTESGSADPAFWSLPDGRLTLAATAGNSDRGALAFFNEAIEPELARLSGVWVTLLDPRAEGSNSMVRLQLGSGKYALGSMAAATDEAARNEFFEIEGGTLSLSQKPILWWGEVAGAVHSLADGSEVAEWMTASLNGTIGKLKTQIFSSSAELNAAVWASLIGVTGLLSSIYFVAVVMALFIIYTLSRAVNRLSRATDAVLAGDFSQRIPVRRHDQIGELQLSFNNMTENLESLIGTAAQKELLEKELEIARDLQESLLPAEVPATERVEFSTLFEPSAAIGGDYFDILRIDDDRLAVVIADVSGHGLPTGLRMAMLKAALVILVEEQKPPSEILRRLNAMVRAEGRQRFFVTATIAVVDFKNDRLEITNAGHPPTYLIRDGEVDEIILAGSPLGALDENYRHTEVQLEAGDVAVWLSDGLIEASNLADEPFGYEATVDALAGTTRSAAEVRDRLLAAVEEHAEGVAADDDRTLVAMRYFPGDLDESSGTPRIE